MILSTLIFSFHPPISAKCFSRTGTFKLDCRVCNKMEHPVIECLSRKKERLKFSPQIRTSRKRKKEREYLFSPLLAALVHEYSCCDCHHSYYRYANKNPSCWRLIDVVASGKDDKVAHATWEGLLPCPNSYITVLTPSGVIFESTLVSASATM